MIKTIIIIILGTLFISSTVPEDNKEDSTFLLIHNVTVIDGKGNPAVRGMDILIENNRIKKIGKAIVVPVNAEEINGEGLTVLPGIIDAHVHISSVPGSTFRNDSLPLYESLQKHHLTAYLACGVTTILDTGIPADEARKINGWLANGNPDQDYCYYHLLSLQAKDMFPIRVWANFFSPLLLLQKML